MLDHLRILLVDDDPSQTEMYAIALGHLGADVAAVATVDEALCELALRPYDAVVSDFVLRPYDAVVSDFVLPGRDGFELARELRAAGAAVPAIALTGLGGDLPRRIAVGWLR